MNSFELHLPDGTPCGIYACGSCKKVYGGHFVPEPKVYAEKCCKPSICNDCGTELPKDMPYDTRCKTCTGKMYETKELDRRKKATVVDAKDWDEAIYTDEVGGYHDEFFESVSELLEYIEDWNEDIDDIDEDNLDDDDKKIDIPEFVWAVKILRAPQLDVCNVVEDYWTEYMPEEWGVGDLRGVVNLQIALDEFTKVNGGLYRWEIDYSKLIKILV